MDKQNIKKIIPEIVRRILAEDGVQKVILFGSVLTERYNEDSDLDLLVIKEQVVDKYKESIYFRRLLKGLGTPIDLILIGQSEYDEKIESPSNIYYWASKSGKIIYDSI